jgi:hypothetical protein
LGIREETEATGIRDSESPSSRGIYDAPQRGPHRD